MDDRNQIYHLIDDMSDQLSVSKIIECKNLDTNTLRKTDWPGVHITKSAIVFDGVIYSLKSNLRKMMRITDSPFDDNIYKSFVTAEQTMILEGGQKEDSDLWEIQTVNNVPLTSCMLMTGSSKLLSI